MPKKTTTAVDHLDRMLGEKKRPRTTGNPPGRPVLGENRRKVMANVKPETYALLQKELLRRRLAGERVQVAPGLDREPHMGDLIDQAVSAQARVWGK